MAIKASNQIDLIDLTDGYSVFLTSESTTFIGTTSSVQGTQSVTTKITALCGDEQVSCSIGTISTVNGITATSDGHSVSPTVTITATSALTTSGSFTIPVIVGDITINKVFSYAIAFKGATGNTGAAGVSITGVTNYYLASAASSGVTTDTTTGWTTTVQTPSAAKKYLWNYESVAYSSGDPTVTTPTIIGNYAASGNDGEPGKGITSIVEYYQVSSSNSTAPSTWVTPPTAIPATTTVNKYLWNYEVITYTDDSTSPTAKKVIGTHGATGATGNDAIHLVVTSSNGTIFKNTAIATTLTARVYKGGAEVTGASLTALGQIKWYKDGSPTSMATGTTLTITAGDVSNKATYAAQLEGA